MKDALTTPIIAFALAGIVLLSQSLLTSIPRAGLELVCVLAGTALGTVAVMLVERLIGADDAPWWITLARCAAVYTVTRAVAYWLLWWGTWTFGWGTGRVVLVATVAATVVYWLWDEDSAQDAFVRAIPVAALAAGLVPLVQWLW